MNDKNTLRDRALHALRPASLLHGDASSYRFAEALPLLTSLLVAWQQTLDKMTLLGVSRPSAAMTFFACLCAGAGSALLSALALCLFAGKDRPTFSSALKVVSLSWLLPFALNALGLLFNLCTNLHTAFLFGLCGLCLSLIPLYEAARRLSVRKDGKTPSWRAALSVLVSGAAGVVLWGIALRLF